MGNAFKACHDGQVIAQTLIPNYHPRLKGKRIDFVFFREEVKKNGKTTLGRARIVSGLHAYHGWSSFDKETGETVQPSGFVEPESFFLIEIWEESWHRFAFHQKCALIDHELCHCDVDFDNEGNERLILVGHDIEEFKSIVSRYGHWLPDVEQFVAACKNRQGSLDFEALEKSLPSPLEQATARIQKEAKRENKARKAKETKPDNTIELFEPYTTDDLTDMTAARMVAEAPASQTPEAGFDIDMPKYVGEQALPSLRLLQEPEQEGEVVEGEYSDRILETLSSFGIGGTVVGLQVGPAVTLYEIELAKGTRTNKITQLADNITMDLAVKGVRIQAPIPGKQAVGIEVPNSQPQKVYLRDICAADDFYQDDVPLKVAVGKDVSGRAVFIDLSAMPHLLIAGTTGSGKSIGLATLLVSLLLKNTPKELRLVLIDPKRVELALFDGIPHLMCPVVKDVAEAPGILRAIWREMDVRYQRFEELGVRNLDGYNQKCEDSDRMPRIVVVIDELADLMLLAAAEVETSIQRLASLARATGIHLVVATQRPSVDVLTGLIKANIPSRISFAVSQMVDSRVVLDQPGAEKLMGKGDMLLMPIDAAGKPRRVQGAYVSEDEALAVCNYWRSVAPPLYVLNALKVAIAADDEESGRDDEYFMDAAEFAFDRQQCSTSMLQRKFSIGFQRASRILDALESAGIVGERDGPRPRQVLVTSSAELHERLSGRKQEAN